MGGGGGQGAGQGDYRMRGHSRGSPAMFAEAGGGVEEEEGEKLCMSNPGGGKGALWHHGAILYLWRKS